MRLTTWKHYGLLAIPTIVAGFVFIVLLNWHISTRVRVNLKTDRITFKVAGPNKSTILQSVGLSSITIEKFENIKFKPESFKTVTQPQKSGSERNRPRAAFTIQQQPVVISSRDPRLQSNVTFKVPDQSGVVLINGLLAEPSSEVTLENTNDENDLIVQVGNQRSAGNLTATGPLVLAVDQSDISGVQTNIDRDKPLAVTTKLLRDSSIEFNGAADSLILTLTIPPEKAGSLFSPAPIPIEAIKFEKVDAENGSVISSLMPNMDCEITFPDYQKMEKAVIRSPAMLTLNDLQNFSIEQLTFEPGKKDLSVTIHGVAGIIKSGSSAYSKDHRVTVYDSIWSNHKVIALFSVLCWVAGATTAVHKLTKEK